MKEINIVSLQMVKTGTLSYLKNRISSPEDAAEIIRSFIGNSDQEHLMLICMNNNNETTNIQSLSFNPLISKCVLFKLF